MFNCHLQHRCLSSSSPLLDGFIAKSVDKGEEKIMFWCKIPHFVARTAGESLYVLLKIFTQICLNDSQTAASLVTPPTSLLSPDVKISSYMHDVTVVRYALYNVWPEQKWMYLCFPEMYNGPKLYSGKWAVQFKVFAVVGLSSEFVSTVNTTAMSS